MNATQERIADDLWTDEVWALLKKYQTKGKLRAEQLEDIRQQLRRSQKKNFECKMPAYFTLGGGVG